MAETPSKIECPAHPGNELKVESAGGKHFAICTCKIPGNRYIGRVVWEQTKAEKLTKAELAEQKAELKAETEGAKP